MVTVAWLFSPPHSHTTSPSLFLSVSVSVCTSLCLLRLLRVALCGSVAYSFSLRYNNEACQNVSLSNKAGTLYQWHQLTLPPLPPSRLKNKKKVLNAVSVQLSNWRLFYRLVVVLVLVLILIPNSRCRCVFAAVATIYEITLAMPVRNFPKYIHTHTRTERERKKEREREVNMCVYLYQWQWGAMPIEVAAVRATA